MKTVEVTDKNYQTLVVESKLPVLLDFWAAWCGPCKALGVKLEQIAEEYEGKAIIAKCNMDDFPDLPNKFGVRGIPAMFLMINGEEKASLVGNHPVENIRNLLDPVITQ